jgi:transcriptional regulator with XRE-family HTH domain
MAILRERKVYRRPKPKADRDQINRLTPEERHNVMAAFEVFRSWRGTVAAVARAMGVSGATVSRVASGHLKPSAGFALKLARAMNAPVENLLQGEWRGRSVRKHPADRRKTVVDAPRRAMVSEMPVE